MGVYPSPNFYHRGRQGSRNVRKGVSGFYLALAARHLRCALCADLEFVVKNPIKP